MRGKLLSGVLLACYRAAFRPRKRVCPMRIAAYLYQGQAGVGRVSADGLQVEPFQVSAQEAALGALPLVEAQAAGRALPATGPAIALQQVQLIAPIPRPRR